jgi:hypothetical protein
VTVVRAPEVIVPLSVVAVLGVVSGVMGRIVLVVEFSVLVVGGLVVAPRGEIAAPQIGVVLGFVMTTSVMTSWRPAGSVNAVTPAAPGSTVCAMATICSTAGAVADSVELFGVVVVVGVVCAPATPAPNTTSAAISSLRVFRPIRDLPQWNCTEGLASRAPSTQWERLSSLSLTR